MLFNSYLFLFLFLPAVMLCFTLAGRAFGARGSLGVLALASLIFYGYWDVAFVPLLLGSIAANFMLGQVLARAMERGDFHARLVFVAGIALNIGLIAFFKYGAFIADNVRAIVGQPVPSASSIILPLGISFFTFQQIAYLGSVYRDGRAERDPLRYFVFISFFAHLIAGPLVHPREILPQLAKIRTRLAPWNVVMGGSLFLVGLAKKVLLADTLSRHADAGFAIAAHAIPDLIQAWGSILAYTLQIYFDFSAYSEMAMGLALIFGIRFPINFNSPYKAASIIDFWRRWHITLSHFLRDFIYIPLGGSRHGPSRRYGALMVTMLLGGLWHGASWTFVAWGGLHGLYLVVNHAWRRLRPQGGTTRLSWLLTFLAVMAAWVLFRADDFPTALRFYQGLAGAAGAQLPASVLARLGEGGAMLVEWGVQAGAGNPFGLAEMALAVAVGLAIALGLPNTIEMFRSAALERQSLVRPRLVWHATAAWALWIGMLAALAVMDLSAPSKFIYFNF